MYSMAMQIQLEKSFMLIYLCNRLFIVERNAVTNRLGINAIYYLLHAWVPHPDQNNSYTTNIGNQKFHNGSVDLLSHFTKVKCDSWT